MTEWHCPVDGRRLVRISEGFGRSAEYACASCGAKIVIREGRNPAPYGGATVWVLAGGS